MEINLEMGHPSVDIALGRMRDALASARRGGARAVIFIHGYGSSGVGGGIRPAVRRALMEPALSSFVKDVCYGEQWHWRKRELTAACRDLAAWEGRVANNEGVTVVLVK